MYNSPAAAVICLASRNNAKYNMSDPLQMLLKLDLETISPTWKIKNLVSLLDIKIEFRTVFQILVLLLLRKWLTQSGI